jgi:hypothetical protein
MAVQQKYVGHINNKKAASIITVRAVSDGLLYYYRRKYGIHQAKV